MHALHFLAAIGALITIAFGMRAAVFAARALIIISVLIGTIFIAVEIMR